MRHAKFIASLVLVISFGGISVAYSGQMHQKNSFSITLPDGWIEIPREVIDAYKGAISRIAPNRQKQDYDYNCGFQLGNAKKWFGYPYIVVQINNTGRIPKNQLENCERIPLQEIYDKNKKGLFPLTLDLRVGKMYYDKQAKIVWLRSESNVVNVGLIAGIIGMVLTEKGFIQVDGWSLKDDFSIYEPIFQSVARSVAPEPWLVYKPKW